MKKLFILATFATVASTMYTTFDQWKQTASQYLGIPLVSTEPQSDASHASNRASDSHGDHAVHDAHANHKSGSEHAGGHHAKHKIFVTSPVVQDVTLTQQYVARVHSRRHIEICALEGGYLKDISINEGQTVKKGDPLFQILPTLYAARLDADIAEAQLSQVEYDNTKRLLDKNIVSPQELKIAEAKLAKANAKVKLAQAEMGFANITAPFDGIVDRLREQEGSLIEEGAVLTTLSDNSIIWVYFNVPEARYLEFQEAMRTDPKLSHYEIQLRLANHKLFDQTGKIGAIEADFDNETGNISFRADFANPDGLLRHGQTGTILIHHHDTGALVIPQRATYEILDKKYVFVVDEQSIAHQREIRIQHEQDDIFVIDEGLKTGEKIVLEGILQVRDGDQVDYEFQAPEEVLAHLKYHAQ
ncbi:MAG: efflux RND transporter periplasmic adaptor subunit [Planctomycetaceae bacterium]|nr:efflux RND transporter periplasmic adaptor subunit [Planctomycetaceae bacterium]